MLPVVSGTHCSVIERHKTLKYLSPYLLFFHILELLLNGLLLFSSWIKINIFQALLNIWGPSSIATMVIVAKIWNIFHSFFLSILYTILLASSLFKACYVLIALTTFGLSMVMGGHFSLIFNLSLKKVFLNFVINFQIGNYILIIIIIMFIMGQNYFDLFIIIQPFLTSWNYSWLFNLILLTMWLIQKVTSFVWLFFSCFGG